MLSVRIKTKEIHLPAVPPYLVIVTVIFPNLQPCHYVYLGSRLKTFCIMKSFYPLSSRISLNYFPFKHVNTNFLYGPEPPQWHCVVTVSVQVQSPVRVKKENACDLISER